MNYIFYCLLIILPIWQDSPLVSILGSYGYSIVPLLSLITIIPYLFLTARDQLVSKGSFTDVWCKLTFYLVVLNFVADLIWLLSGNSYVLRGEDIVAKSIRGILTALSIGCYLIIVCHLSKSFDEERVVRPFFWTFVILSIVAVVEFTQLPNALPFAHYSGIFPYNRPRLLTLEASWTTPLVIIYGGVSLHYCFNVRRWVVPGFAVIASIVFMVSIAVAKSLLVMVIIAAFISLVVLVKKDSRWILLVFPVLLVSLCFSSIFNGITSLFQADIAQYTSTATRSLTNIVAFACSLIYPFGTGNALYLQLFPDMLERFSCFFSSMGLSLNMSEINYYITSNSGFGMSAKSAVLQYGMYWGILGSFFLLRALWHSWRSLVASPKSTRIIIVTFILSVISILFFATFDSQYEFFALMALIDYYSSFSSSSVLDSTNEMPFHLGQS